MWTAKELRELVKAGVYQRHQFRRCSSCALFLDNRNHKRHQVACRKAKKKESVSG